MRKKILALALACTMGTSLAACGGSTTNASTTAAETEAATTAAEKETTTADASEEGAVTGGWTMRSSEEAIYLDEDTRAVFDTVASQIGDAEVKPVALLGTQIVSGTNYCFLAEYQAEDGSAGYMLIFAYHDLDGTDTLTSMQEIDINADSFGKAEDGQLEGGWTVATDTGANPGKSMVDICDKATDMEYTLITTLATQVVSGTNYLMLCETAVSGDQVPELKVLTIYQDLDENASVTDTKAFSISSYAEMD